MRVVVTGGAGFIGANLCRGLRALSPPAEVVVVDDLSTGERGNLEGVAGLELLEGSVLDAALLERAVRGAEAVVHLAALPSVPRSLEDPMASHEANATGTMYVLEAARRAGGPYVVVASSSSVYGANPELPKREDMAARPLSPYAASKLATESYALAYGASFDLPVLALRFFNVFGPWQSAGHAYAAVVPAFIDAALRDQPLTVHGDGGQTRDFTFVGSVVDVLLRAVARRTTHLAPVNLAFGSRVSVLDLVGELEAVLDRSLPVHHTAPRPGDVRDSQADQATLRGLFPDAHPVALVEGLRRTVDWFRETGAGPLTARPGGPSRQRSPDGAGPGSGGFAP